MKQTLLICLVILSVIGCKKDPSASFTTDKSSYYLQQNISFSNSSKNAKSYTWDFGDGASSSETSPSHSYSKAGTYNVKLTLDNGTVFSKNIKINNGTASYTILSNLGVSVSQFVSVYPENGVVVDVYVHGNGIFNNGQRTDTVFTNRAVVHCGFIYGPNQFLTEPYALNKSEHKNILLNDDTRVVTAPISGNNPTAQNFTPLLQQKATVAVDSKIKQVN